MTTIHHSPPPGATPFAIYEDPEDQEPPSPSEVYEGEVSFASEMSFSGADVAIPTIEGEHDLQEEPEPYSGSYTSRRPSILLSSRPGSTVTANSFVSSLPSEISVASKPVPPTNALESRYSPRKERPPFRNPASVRAMQMASPPPLLALEASRERMKGSYKLSTPSRSARSNSVSTTGTRRSRSHRESVHREYQAEQSPRPSAIPQPLPLVLLHVTILPIQMPYTPEIMVKIMPEWLVENYKVLEHKLQDIVLMRRGLLIQHPRDEYDVLEERILESLELKTPRLLKCGHFVAPDSDDEDAHGDDEERNGAMDNGTGRGSRISGGTVTSEGDPDFRYPTPNSDDASVCMDCHRQVKKPGHGVGAGTKRWDIKIYAANGLMRAGAWVAAWSEMERCDVEISPWIPNEVRKTIERRLEQEQEAAKVKALYAAELRRQIEEEATMQKKLEEDAAAKKKAEEAELRMKIEAEAAALQQKLEEEAAEKRQLEATLNEKIEEAKEAIRLEFEAQALAKANCVTERFRAMEDALKNEREKTAVQAPPVLQDPRALSRSHSRSRHRNRSRSRRSRIEEIPLGTLLKNYFVLQLQDSRNIFILILGTLVVFLLMNSNPNWNLPPTLDLAPEVSEPVIPVVITSTATMTMTSLSTLVVTEVRSAVTALPTELDADAESESAESDNMVLEEEPSASEEESATSIDELVSAEITSESMEPSEIPTSSVEATPLLPQDRQYNDRLYPETVQAEEVAMPTEAASFSTAVEESSAEPSSTAELDTPLEPASPAEDSNGEEHVEPETQPVDAQESEELQLDENPSLSVDSSPDVHERDEL